MVIAAPDVMVTYRHPKAENFAPGRRRPNRWTRNWSRCGDYGIGWLHFSALEHFRGLE